MDRLSSKLVVMASMLKAGNTAIVASEIKRWLWSEALYYGLRRDLAEPFETPDAKTPLIVRPLEAADVTKIMAANGPGTAGRDRLERLTRLRLLSADIGTCYVAVTQDNYPCYMQWLIAPNENDQVQSYFRGVFPRLGFDEAMLEGALTHEDFRGQGIMPYASSQIAERAAEFGARKVIRFTGQDNIASLKGCKKAGFSPYMTRRDKWRLFRRESIFTLLPMGTPYNFDTA